MKKPVFHIIGALIISLILISTGLAYVLSAEQMLGPFLQMCRGFHTVKIGIETTIFDVPDGKAEVREQLVIQQGGQFRAERIFPYGENILIQDGRRSVVMGVQTSNSGARRIDTVFPTIFFQKSLVDLLNALNFLGVDTRSVGIDRIERKQVFAIGNSLDQVPGSRLWIERERGLPLRFIGVGIAGKKTTVLRAEYTEYRQVGKDMWLPGKIEYYRDDVLWVVSLLHDISLNEDLPATLFRIPSGENSSPVIDFLNIKE